MTKRLLNAERGLVRKAQNFLPTLCPRHLKGNSDPDGDCRICDARLERNSECLLDKFLCNTCQLSHLKGITRSSTKQCDLFEELPSSPFSKTRDTQSAVIEE